MKKKMWKKERPCNIFRIHRSHHGVDLDVRFFRARLIQHAMPCFIPFYCRFKTELSSLLYVHATLLKNRCFQSKLVSTSFRSSASNSRCKHFKFSTDQHKCQMSFLLGKFIANCNHNLILTTFKCEKRGSNTNVPYGLVFVLFVSVGENLDVWA